MSSKHHSLFAISALSLALAACNNEPEAVDDGDNDMELAEDAIDSNGAVADEMDSGAPEIREGGGRAVGEADNPNEPVVPDDAEPTTDPAEVR